MTNRGMVVSKRPLFIRLALSLAVAMLSLAGVDLGRASSDLRLLKYVKVTGPTQVKENSRAYYTCRLYSDDGSSEDVTAAASWSADSWYASFENSGKLVTTSVTSNQWCRITATYEGLSVNFDIVIENSEINIVRIKVFGPTEVDENSSAYYTCTAYYDDGTTEDISYSVNWSENSWYATISSSGRLETSSVSSDEWCRITADFRGVSDYLDVKIKDKEQTYRIPHISGQ